MKRKKFVKESQDSLPLEFRSRIRNVAVLVEDVPQEEPSPQAEQPGRPTFGCLPWRAHDQEERLRPAMPTGPDHIVLYQKNIEAVCSSEAEVREQIRRTVIHELGHYFGMDEQHEFGSLVWPGCGS